MTFPPPAHSPILAARKTKNKSGYENFKVNRIQLELKMLPLPSLWLFRWQALHSEASPSPGSPRESRQSPDGPEWFYKGTGFAFSRETWEEKDSTGRLQDVSVTLVRAHSAATWVTWQTDWASCELGFTVLDLTWILSQVWWAVSSHSYFSLDLSKHQWV